MYSRSYFTCLFLLADPCLSLFPGQYSLTNEKNSVTDICISLSTQVPTFFPESPEYTNQQNLYYSHQQSSLQPTCRLLPSSSHSLSTILPVLHFQAIPFAIKSGGHSSVPKTSNTDENGITIDLSSLLDFELNPEKGSIIIGSGWRWGPLYKKLAEYNISTIGARVGTIGVGGYLLGGGLNFYSNSFGWASNSILSYELVLSSGTILNISDTTHPEAFWALKGSNFLGVVTKFEVETRGLEEILFGGYVFETRVAREVYQGFVEYCLLLKGAGETTTLLNLKVGFEGEAVVTISHTTSPATSSPSRFLTERFDNIPSRSSEVNARLLTDVIDHMEEAFGNMQWKATLTLKASELITKLMLDIQKEVMHTASLIESTCKGEGYLALFAQPLGDVFTANSNVDDVFGLHPDDENDSEVPIIFFFQSTWTPASSESEDTCILNLSKQSFRRIEILLEQEGALHPFRYQNYASGTQLGYEGYGEKNLARLREVRKRYGGIREV